jgi:hypothetical protein
LAWLSTRVLLLPMLLLLVLSLTSPGSSLVTDMDADTG